MSDSPPEPKRTPNPERMSILRSLPVEIKQQIAGEEAHAFLYDEEVPDSRWRNLRTTWSQSRDDH